MELLPPCLVSVCGYSGESDRYSGKIVLVDRHANTITIETPTGLQEFAVDSSRITIEEVGPIIGYEENPSLKDLMLGDIVTVYESEPSATSAHQILKRIRRARPGP